MIQKNNQFAYGLNSNSVYQGDPGQTGDKGVFIYVCFYDGYVQRKIIEDRIMLNLSLNSTDSVQYNIYDKIIDINNNIFEIKDNKTGKFDYIGNFSFDFFIETFKSNNLQRLSNDYISNNKFIKDNINLSNKPVFDASIYNNLLYDVSLGFYNENNIFDYNTTNLKVWTNGDKNLGLIFKNGIYRFGNDNNNDIFDCSLILDFKNIIIDPSTSYTNMLLSNNDINAENIFDNIDFDTLDSSILYVTKSDDPSVYIIHINDALDEYDKTLQINWQNLSLIEANKINKLFFINSGSDIDEIKCYNVSDLNTFKWKISIFNKYGWEKTFTGTLNFEK